MRRSRNRSDMVSSQGCSPLIDPFLTNFSSAILAFGSFILTMRFTSECLMLYNSKVWKGSLKSLVYWAQAVALLWPRQDWIFPFCGIYFPSEMYHILGQLHTELLCWTSHMQTDANSATLDTLCWVFVNFILQSLNCNWVQEDLLHNILNMLYKL